MLNLVEDAVIIVLIVRRDIIYLFYYKKNLDFFLKKMYILKGSN